MNRPVTITTTRTDETTETLTTVASTAAVERVVTSEGGVKVEPGRYVTTSSTSTTEYVIGGVAS